MGINTPWYWQWARPLDLDNSRDSQQSWDSDPERLIQSKQGSTVGSCSLASPRLCSEKSFRCSSPGRLFRITWRRLPRASSAWCRPRSWGRIALISAVDPPAHSHWWFPLASPSIWCDFPSPEILQHFCFFPDILPGCHHSYSLFSLFLS